LKSLQHALPYAEAMRPPRARLLLAIAPSLGICVVLSLLAVSLFRQDSSRRPSTSSGSSALTGGTSFYGAALPAGVVAAGFTLTDLRGRPISLQQFRGRVTVLTFLYSTCGAPCVLIAQQIRGALDELGRAKPVVLIVSASPHADTPAHVGRFLDEVSLAGRVHYLTGPPSRLRTIWRSYRVTPASAGRAAFARVASVLLIDGHGHERVIYQQEQLTPEALAHDIGKLQDR
jgi:protein SCO1